MLKNNIQYTIIVLLLNLNILYSQDTIYSDAYPKGILVPSVDLVNYKSKLYPINNSGLELIIPKKQIIKIVNLNGLKYENPEYIKSNDVVVPIDILTGKVIYIGIIEVKDAKKKVLFNALKTLPSSNIQYTLLSSDEIENTFMQYSGKFNARFAGDLYDVNFSLTLKFKDGKIKYDYHDFIFCFEEVKEKHSGTIIGGYTVGTKYRKSDPLEKFYIPGYRGDKFWLTIYTNMENALKAINKTCTDFTTDKDGF